MEDGRKEYEGEPYAGAHSIGWSGAFALLVSASHQSWDVQLATTVYQALLVKQTIRDWHSILRRIRLAILNNI